MCDIREQFSTLLEEQKQRKKIEKFNLQTKLIDNGNENKL